MDSKKRPLEDSNTTQEPPLKKPTVYVPREPSIFNVKVIDDITRYIADFIGQYCNRDHLEIEAKLGIFVDKRSGRRINIGALTETSNTPTK